MDDGLVTKTRRNEQDYTQALKIKAIDLEPLSNIMPTYTDEKPIILAIKQNLIHFSSDQDAVYGLLYLIMDTSILANGPPMRIQLTPNPGASVRNNMLGGSGTLPISGAPFISTFGRFPPLHFLQKYVTFCSDGPRRTAPVLITWNLVNSSTVTILKMY